MPSRGVPCDDILPYKLTFKRNNLIFNCNNEAYRTCYVCAFPLTVQARSVGIESSKLFDQITGLVVLGAMHK